jgi:hypothetical protein
LRHGGITVIESGVFPPVAAIERSLPGGAAALVGAVTMPLC